MRDPRYPRFPHPHLHGRQRFFMPFAMFFGGITLLFLIAIGLVVYFVLTPESVDLRGGILIPLCGLPVAFLLISLLISSFAFRRFGRPMADVFSAIDTVAEGDLTVRVAEHYPHEFGLLARRFNHMISELERADRQRRNLTADVAHDLRTPLHIIQGNLEGILDGVYQPTPDHINNTLEETRLLARLVDDLQTISLAEAGQLPLHPSLFPLTDIIQDVCSAFDPLIASRGLKLEMNTPESSLEITADYDRLHQILSNLISNAIRHSPDGGLISIKSEMTTKGIRIEVRDTGSGIPPEDLPYIFDRFWRGEKPRTGRDHSGLGLAIVKQLVQAHGGSIEVQSQVDQGTIFVISLPV